MVLLSNCIRVLPFIIISGIRYFLYRKKQFLIKSIRETLKINSSLRKKLVKVVSTIIMRILGKRF